MAKEIYKISPYYLKRKKSILEDKNISFVSSLFYRGTIKEVEEMKAFLGNDYFIQCESNFSEITEGMICVENETYRIPEDTLTNLMNKYPCLKWIFFFVCDPFWQNISKEDQDKKAICVGYSDSGVSVANRYRVITKTNNEKKLNSLLQKRVLTFNMDGISNPFKKEWKNECYVSAIDGDFYQERSKNATVLMANEDGKDMYQAYRRNMARYKSAMIHGFYYEAMLIDYALIEDVTYEFLYHIGLFENRSIRTVNRKIKDRLLFICNSTKSEDERLASLRVDMISKKLDIIKSLAKWTDRPSDSEIEDPYVKRLRNTMESCDIKHLMDTCDYVSWWLSYRNEIMHAMMKRDVYSMHAEIEDIALEGMEYFKVLSSQKDVIKKGKLRKHLKLK